MDPASLAISITALYATCHDCYSFFTAVSSAEKKSSVQLRELEIQQSILKAWGFHWQIQDYSSAQLENSDQRPISRTKLHEYLVKNPYKAEGVFKTLSALADTLSNQERLVKRYGIELLSSEPDFQPQNNVQLMIEDATVENTSPVVKEIKSRLNMLKKLRWALQDRDGFKKLIAELRFYSESLYRLCPEHAFESMNIYLTMDCLEGQESRASLKTTSNLATHQAEIDNGSSTQRGYTLLASAATLKACINDNRRSVPDNFHLGPITDKEVHQRIHYLGKGLAIFEQQVVYVKMRDYRGLPLPFTPAQRQRLQAQRTRRRRAKFLKSLRADDPFSLQLNKVDIDQLYEEYRSDSEEDEEDETAEVERPADAKLRALIQNFYNTFRGANLQECVYGLDIAGMIDHTEGEHKGFCSILYNLPGNVGVPTRERPAGNLKLRAPVTLASLLGTRLQPGIKSTLGARFELARKLVRAVCLLHASGWLHKNIRAESVIFFPKHVSSMEHDHYELELEIDVSKPILMGYVFSRPDDITKRAHVRGLTEAKKLPVPPSAQKPSLVHAVPSLRPPDTYSHTWRKAEIDEVVERAESYDRTSSKGVGKGKDTNISGFILDYYQHPAKHADPLCI